MGEHADLTGPDFSVGIDAATLGSGEKLLGHVKDEAVLLARGLAGDVREAERLLKVVRPGVKLQRQQRALLKRLFHSPPPG